MSLHHILKDSHLFKMNLKDNNAKNIIFYFSISFFFLLLIPRLFTFGLFLDGTIYASIARNMADEMGTFWKPFHPYYPNEIFPYHPPLGFWLQSWVYKIMGNSHLIDGIYGLICSVLMFFLMHQIWKNELKNQTDKLSGVWPSILILAFMPMVTWSFSNNMLENSLVVFSLLAVYLQSAGQYELPFRRPVYFLLSGVILAFGIIVKNPAVIFPLALPGIKWLVKKQKFSTAVFDTFYISFALIITLYLIFLPEEAKKFLTLYLDKQLVKSISGNAAGESGSSWMLLYYLLNELLVPFVIISIAAIFIKKRNSALIIKNRESLLFLLIGISASIPLILSSKYRKYYIVTSLPYYALSITLFFNPIFFYLEQKLKENEKLKKFFFKSSIAIFSGAIVVSLALIDYPVRYREFYNDFYKNKYLISDGIAIKYCDAKMSKDWGLMANMQRFFKATWVNPDTILLDKKYNCILPKNCAFLTPENFERFALYRCPKEN